MKYITFLWSRSRIAPWNTTANVVISKSCMLVCAIVPVPFPRPSILVRAYTGADAQGGRSAGTRARAARRGRQAARTSDRSARLRGKGAFPIHPSHALQSSESCAVLVMRRRSHAISESGAACHARPALSERCVLSESYGGFETRIVHPPRL